ncbi:hypothetical protein GCM10029976_037830 [Kribbella albertanoniae]|uniref:Ribosomal protein L7/L12 C-terminal domain-containing protein n=1 Tax=Kribbella albertanoniae TaxID=1266829 RepID=A0A4R4Q1W8_9ACTN|nr:hypothetical protein [Kribbella albertanoniae]TDC28934.1 hypothetical protein E1261_17210 [Kribbella albertanoniae]
MSTTELGLLLSVGPVALIALSALAFRLFGPGRSAKQLTSSPSPTIDPVRLDLARSVATTQLAPHQVPDDATLAQVLLLRDNGKPTHAAKLLRTHTGASLTAARRLLDRLP